MAHGITQQQFEYHLKNLLQCEKTGVKPRVYRALLEEIQHSWATIHELEEAISELRSHISVEDYETVDEPVKQMVRFITKELYGQATEAATEPEPTR